MSLKHLDLTDRSHGEFKKLWTAKVDELPRCMCCHKEIIDGDYAYFCNIVHDFICKDHVLDDHCMPVKGHVDFFCIVELIK